MNTYQKEARERWGHTTAYKESVKRVAKMTKEDMTNIQKESDNLMKEIAQNMSKGPKSEEVQKLIARHYNNLRHFYEPTLQIYKGLGDLYVDDPRFTAYFEKYTTGLAKFMKEAIYEYCREK